MSGTEPPSSLSIARPRFRVALAQIEPRLGDIPANLRKHLEQIELARQATADLIVFPELSLTGYYLRDHVIDVAQPFDAPMLVDLAQSTGPMAAVFGFVEESPSHCFYNAAAFADGGVISSIHRKVYLPTYGMFDEQRYFAAGDRVRAFATRFGRVGLLICEDAWHLSCGTILLADAIDLLIVVANSPGRGVTSNELGSRASWDLVTRTYAQSLGVPVIFVNRVGYEDGVNFWGGSRVLSASAVVLAEAPEMEPGLVLATIDPRDTRRQRILAPLARDERLELTLRELERIRNERQVEGIHN